MKHAQKLTRLLLVLLALAMVLSTFAACATEDDDTNPSSSDATGTTPESGEDDSNPGYGEELDENGYVKDDIPDGLNFGDEFHILAASTQQSSFYATKEDVDTVKVALFKRNMTVEDRLGISFVWNLKPCYASADKTAFAQIVETDAQAGNEIDGVISYNLVPYRLANKGLCENLADTTYINLEKPWWPEEYLNTMKYKGQIFALVDNASVGTLANLQGIFFNNEMLENKGIQSPYELVDKNEWTISKLKELSKDTYEDKNANGKVDAAEDIFGVVTSTSARITCWYYGAGIRFTNMDANGDIVLVDDVEYISTRLDSIIDLFDSDDNLLVDSKQYVAFKEERAYFYLCILGLCSNMVNNDIDIDYGVVPTPKFNSEQSRYYTHIPNCHDAWFIPKGVDNVDCSSAFIEAMISESYRQVNHVYFETNLKIRYAPDERLAAMYDLMRDTITFDFLYIYKEVTGTNIDSEIVSCIKSPASYNWATKWAGIKDSVNTQFNEILAIYEAGAQ